MCCISSKHTLENDKGAPTQPVWTVHHVHTITYRCERVFCGEAHRHASKGHETQIQLSHVTKSRRLTWANRLSIGWSRGLWVLALLAPPPHSCSRRWSCPRVPCAVPDLCAPCYQLWLTNGWQMSLAELREEHIAVRLFSLLLKCRYTSAGWAQLPPFFFSSLFYSSKEGLAFFSTPFPQRVGLSLLWSEVEESVIIFELECSGYVNLPWSGQVTPLRPPALMFSVPVFKMPP